MLALLGAYLPSHGLGSFSDSGPKRPRKHKDLTCWLQKKSWFGGSSCLCGLLGPILWGDHSASQRLFDAACASHLTRPVLQRNRALHHTLTGSNSYQCHVEVVFRYLILQRHVQNVWAHAIHKFTNIEDFAMHVHTSDRAIEVMRLACLALRILCYTVVQYVWCTMVWYVLV